MRKVKTTLAIALPQPKKIKLRASQIQSIWACQWKGSHIQFDPELGLIALVSYWLPTNGAMKQPDYDREIIRPIRTRNYIFLR